VKQVVAGDSEENAFTRVLAVLLAIPVFGISLYLGLAAAVQSPSLAARLLTALPLYFYLAYFGLALVVGLWSGVSGIVSLLGHLFGTHFERQADRRITMALWAGLACATLLAYAIGRSTVGT
jgi:hypothetical protein